MVLICTENIDDAGRMFRPIGCTSNRMYLSSVQLRIASQSGSGAAT